MKKHLFMAIVASVLLFCGTANAFNKKMPLASSGYNIIGYAYFNNGDSKSKVSEKDNLIEVSPTLHSAPYDIQVVPITQGGIYPNYLLPTEDLKKLHLISKQEAELENFAKQKSQELDALYTKPFTEYKDNMSLISFTYSVSDKSGLFQNKELEGEYRIALNAPAKKNYTYAPLYESETFTMEDALSKIASLKEKIDQEFQKDLKEYKTYLSTAFKSYTVVGQSEKKFSYNSNISFNTTLKAPTEVPYTLGKKINITIPITIESANLNNMVPKTYSLGDSNFIAVMGANSDLSVNGVLSNKTQSFLTVKSLTCYYQNLVNNISNLDKELAPESRDFDDGTRYELLSNTMKEKASFTQITKSKADSMKINYGYAVKYKVNNTNIEKALYTTKNYSLYDIYRQYL